MVSRELSAQERTALIAWHLAHGEGLTVRDVMRLTGLRHSRARQLMYEISRVIPIYCEGGVWQVCALQEAVPP